MKLECCFAYHNCFNSLCEDASQTSFDNDFLSTLGFNDEEQRSLLSDGNSRSDSGYFSSTQFEFPSSNPTSVSTNVVSYSPPLQPIQVSEVQTPAPAEQFTCKWQNCESSFSTLNDLVGHVNVSHLLPSQTPEVQQSVIKTSVAMDATKDNVFENTFNSLCHWNDCHGFNLASVAGSSTACSEPWHLLSDHLLHDHLGVSGPHHSHLPAPAGGGGFSEASIKLPHSNISQHPVVGTNQNINILPTSTGSSEMVTSQSGGNILATPAPSPPPESSPFTQGPPHDCATSAHPCRWTGCFSSFDSCDALTEHLTNAHVGFGKRTYECFWDGCGRNGENGFSSKQKVLRHLQAHTGHRPFVCDQCGQHFSEAATLQQHIRRHTQESK